MRKDALEKFRADGVAIYDEMPEGWKILEHTNTAPRGYKWASNGKSLFGGEHRYGLVRISDEADNLHTP